MINADGNHLKPLNIQNGASCNYGAQFVDVIFNHLGIKAGHYFLDAGCGPGEYALLASEKVGEGGRVFALDRDPKMIEYLQHKIISAGKANIVSKVADLGDPLPMADQSVDSALLSSVLHMPGLTERWHILFAELQRALRPGGRLAIIEKDNSGADPNAPLHWRLSPQLLTEEVRKYGFRKLNVEKLTPSRFLILFESLAV